MFWIPKHTNWCIVQGIISFALQDKCYFTNISAIYFRGVMPKKSEPLI